MASNSETLAKISIEGDMPSKPLGFYVLVEVIEVETTSAGGIYMGNQGREQAAEEAGYLRAVGPTAYHGWEGCKQDVMITPTPEGTGIEGVKEIGNKPYQKWGLELGDMVEFRAFEGKKCAIPGYERWRYIPDSHIVGVINQDKAEPSSMLSAANLLHKKVATHE